MYKSNLKLKLKMLKGLSQFFLLVIFIFSFIAEISAECATIYFYRKNTVQSDRTLYFFNGSEKLGTVDLGDRYKATVCADGNYSFVVKLEETGMSIHKKTINVQAGKEYYVKISCVIGADLPSIALMDTGKGRKDWNKGSKFLGQIKQLQVGNSNGYVGGVTRGRGGHITPSSKDFKRTQIVNNFKFEIVNIARVGITAQISFKITNLENDDRQLKFGSPCISFYDDLGSIVSAKDACIAGRCQGETSYSFDGDVNKIKRAYKNRNVSTIEKLMPSKIPLKASISFNTLHKRTTKFIRGSIWAQCCGQSSEGPIFEIPFYNIVFPKVVDINNPNKRNLGTGSMELVNIKRDGSKTVAHFKFQNLSDANQELLLKEVTTYDDQGNQHEADKISFVSKYDKQDKYRWKYTVNSGGQIDFYVFLSSIKSNVKNLPRFTINLGQYKLDWENIAIEGDRVSINRTPTETNRNQTGNNFTQTSGTARYIKFNNLASNLSNYESSVGSKVILDNIYFNSGEDKLLPNSYPQLDKLTTILKSNRIIKLSISGHTDDVGDDTSNLILSQKRADAVKYYLMGKGIDISRMSSVGQGENNPLDSNSTQQGKQKNRRVEIELVK